MPELNRSKLAELLKSEEQLFHENHPKSYELHQRARKSLHGGVPMLWMIRWAGSFPVFVREAKGARFTDVDGNPYIDFCLGDTGALTGHSPDATSEQIQKGITLMLPYEDVIWVGEELQRRFGLPCWQFALTATDANRFALRMARMITGRPKVLVFNYCFHSSVDESLIVLDEEGTPICLVSFLGIMLWLRFSNLDMTQIDNLATYWPAHLLALVGVILSGVLYYRSST